MATSSRSPPSYIKYETRKRNPNPLKSVLLVIMQNYFSSIAKPIIINLTTGIENSRRESIPVFFTRHSHKSPSDHDMLGEWWSDDLIIHGTVDADFIPDIGRLVKGDHEIVEKSTYSAFANTRLHERLVEIGVEEVIVTGVMSNLCCETTARDAFLRGFSVFFWRGTTATVDEELHEATLKNLAYGSAYLVD